MPGYVRVTNKRRDMAPDSQPEPGESVIPVDRSNPVLGNPYVLRNKNDRAERMRVIDAYRRLLEKDMARNGPMSQEIRKIAERVRQGERICLQCWCAPLPCHGDVIAEAVRRMAMAH